MTTKLKEKKVVRVCKRTGSTKVLPAEKYDETHVWLAASAPGVEHKVLRDGMNFKYRIPEIEYKGKIADNFGTWYNDHSLIKKR